MKRHLIFPIVLLVAIGVNAQALAQGDDLAAKTQNPIGSMISVPFENTFDFGAPNGGAYILNLQPVIPQAVHPDWNIIHRPIIPIANAPGRKSGRDRAWNLRRWHGGA